MSDKEDSPLIQKIEEYWDVRPCNIRHSQNELGSIEYFDEVERKRYFAEPHIPHFASFKSWNGKRVLEIGCGIGTDGVNFAKNGAEYYGIELSNNSLNVAKDRFNKLGLRGNFYHQNAEEDLSFLGDGKFDMIYSFGVIHHSPNPSLIINNAYNLLKKGGILKIMLYATNSWKKLLIDNNLSQYEAQSNCPLAQTYTKEEVKELLNKFQGVEINQNHIFPYKIPEYIQGKYVKEDWFEQMPNELFAILKENLGWHLCITAKK
jgi:ubiquinone/menaquinone biosynthesis C-methylase UbiE